MKILNILDTRKVKLTKFVQFQGNFELEVPVWVDYISLDYNIYEDHHILMFGWEEEPCYDHDEQTYCQNYDYPDSEYKQLQYAVIIDGEFEPICEKVKTIYEVRKDVLNMDIDMWKKYDVRFLNYRGTAEWFLTNIGLPGSLSAKCNEHESRFFNEIYKLHREKTNENYI